MNSEGFSGNVSDLNGEGIWSVESVQQRYRTYCAAAHAEPCRSLTPREHEAGRARWIYPIMEQVIRGIEENDPACIELGVDFVEEDSLFPFGKTLKSNTARALRRASLTESQNVRLRRRISTMLISGVIPHEMREYVKLLRAIGVGECWPQLEGGIPRSNPYVMRFYKSLREAEGLPV